jgi:hypothetical protein
MLRVDVAQPNIGVIIRKGKSAHLSSKGHLQYRFSFIASLVSN